MDSPVDLKRKREVLDPDCSICLEAVAPQGPRSIAKLVCRHEFHLDCICSAFNAKGALQCPNCRLVETALPDTTDTMPNAPTCFICSEVWISNGSRSIAKLQCGHEFHLDCIISAYNAKGAMRCPNCGREEKDRWICKPARAEIESLETPEVRQHLRTLVASLLANPTPHNSSSSSTPSSSSPSPSPSPSPTPSPIRRARLWPARSHRARLQLSCNIIRASLLREN